MTTPEAKRPYGERREPTQNPISLPIRFEYAGNYSNFISLNESVLHQLVDIIGTPKTTLVIKDGKERIERTEILVGTFKGPFVDGSKEDMETKDLWDTNLNEKKSEFEVLINSQVIDGRIREFYPTENYERIFLQTLEEITMKGVWVWALYETQKKGLSNILENRRKAKQLEKFFLEYGSHILIKNSPCRQNRK